MSPSSVAGLQARQQLAHLLVAEFQQFCSSHARRAMDCCRAPRIAPRPGLWPVAARSAVDTACMDAYVPHSQHSSSRIALIALPMVARRARALSVAVYRRLSSNWPILVLLCAVTNSILRSSMRHVVAGW